MLSGKAVKAALSALRCASHWIQRAATLSKEALQAPLPRKAQWSDSNQGCFMWIFELPEQSEGSACFGGETIPRLIWVCADRRGGVEGQEPASRLQWQQAQHLSARSAARSVHWQRAKALLLRVGSALVPPVAILAQGSEWFRTPLRAFPASQGRHCCCCCGGP